MDEKTLMQILHRIAANTSPQGMKLFNTVLGLLGVGFLAWAGVVWDTGATVERGQERLLVQMQHLMTMVVETKALHASHDAEPWHSGAGRELATIAAELQSLRYQLERLEKERLRDDN